MTFGDALTALREDFLKDEIPDEPQWSDAQLMRFYNQAILEACERAPLLRGETTIAVKAARGDYYTDKSVRLIESARLSDGTILTQSTDAELTAKFGREWRDETGTPTRYVRKQRNIRLFPEPEADDTLTLDTIRLPSKAEEITSTAQSTPIPERYHFDLLYWVAYLCFSIPDPDKLFVEKVQRYKSLFEQRFGPRKTAQHDEASQSMPYYAVATGGRFA